MLIFVNKKKSIGCFTRLVKSGFCSGKKVASDDGLLPLR